MMSLMGYIQLHGILLAFYFYTYVLIRVWKGDVRL